MHRPSVRAAVVGLAFLLLAGCSSDPTVTPPVTPSAEPTDDPTRPAASTTLHLKAADIEVDVLPLVRAGEHVVLTLDLEMEDTGGEQVFLGSNLGGQSWIHLPALAGTRLVDLERDVVHTVAVDAKGRTVTTGKDYITLEPGARMRLQTAYAAPPQDVTSLGLFLPGGPYVESVPVVDGDVPPLDPSAATPSADAPALDLGEVADAPVVGLESFTAELRGAVQTLTTSEKVEVTLGSDVLFATDSADLTPDAQAALDAVAAHLSAREPGEVLVVGHTDDVASDDYNQALSERRAQAVAAALGQRVDTSRFPMRTEGRGEREPVANGTDEESRARNRRVTVTLTSEVTTTTDVTTEGELPPFDGAVGTGTEGVVVENLGTYRITADARRVDGHVVVDLHVAPVDERGQSGVSFLSGIWHYRAGALGVTRSASGLVVLRGGTAVYPMDYLAAVRDDGSEQWLPMTDLETLSDIAPDAARTFSVVYPDVGDLDEIAVQVDEGLGTRAFRLTDIPVR